MAISQSTLKRSFGGGRTIERCLTSIKLKNSTRDILKETAYKATGDGDPPTEKKCVKPGRVVSEKNRLQRVEKAEVEAAIDEDAHAADHEASVETADAIWSEM